MDNTDPKNLEGHLIKNCVVWCIKLGSCVISTLDGTDPKYPIVCTSHTGRRTAKFTLDGKSHIKDNEQSLFSRNPHIPLMLEEDKKFPRTMLVTTDNTSKKLERLVLGYYEKIGYIYVSGTKSIQELEKNVNDRTFRSIGTTKVAVELPKKIIKKISMKQLALHFEVDEVEITD